MCGVCGCTCVVYVGVHVLCMWVYMCCVCGCTCVVYVGVHVWCMWVYMCGVCGCTCVVYVGVHVWCMWVYMCGVCGCTCVVMWVYISIYDCSQFTFMYQIFLQELVAELGDLLYQVRVYMSVYVCICLYMSVYVCICPYMCVYASVHMWDTMCIVVVHTCSTVSPSMQGSFHVSEPKGVLKQEKERQLFVFGKAVVIAQKVDLGQARFKYEQKFRIPVSVKYLVLIPVHTWYSCLYIPGIHHCTCT